MPPNRRVVELSACWKRWNSLASLLLGHADPGVGDLEEQVLRPVRAALPGRRQGDDTFLGELGRVAEQVQHHLPRLGQVGLHRAEVGREVQLEPVGFLGDEAADGVGEIAQHRLDLKALDVDLHLAAFDLAEVEHAVDEAEQVARVALDLAEVGNEVLGLRDVVDLLRHHLGVADDRRERRAQLVAHVGEEGRLGEIGGFRCRLGGGELQLGPFLVVDVGVGADPAQDRARAVELRQRTGDVPAIGAIRAAEAELDLVDVAGGQRNHPTGGCDRQIFRVHKGRPAEAAKGDLARPAVREGAVVGPVEHPVGLGGSRPGLGSPGSACESGPRLVLASCSARTRSTVSLTREATSSTRITSSGDQRRGVAWLMKKVTLSRPDRRIGTETKARVSTAFQITGSLSGVSNVSATATVRPMAVAFAQESPNTARA